MENDLIPRLRSEEGVKLSLPTDEDYDDMLDEEDDDDIDGDGELVRPTFDEPVVTTLQRATAAAVELRRLGVSEAQTGNLLAHYPIEEIEVQLSWISARKPRKAAALLVRAITEGYEKPADL